MANKDYITFGNFHIRHKALNIFHDALFPQIWHKCAFLYNKSWNLSCELIRYGLTNLCVLDPNQIRTDEIQPPQRNCFFAQFVLMCKGSSVEPETGWHLEKLRCLCHHFPYFFGCSTPRFIISIILSAFYYSFLPSSLSSPAPAATPGIIKIKTSEILQHTHTA